MRRHCRRCRAGAPRGSRHNSACQPRRVFALARGTTRVALDRMRCPGPLAPAPWPVAAPRLAPAVAPGLTLLLQGLDLHLDIARGGSRALASSPRAPRRFDALLCQRRRGVARTSIPRVFLLQVQGGGLALWPHEKPGPRDDVPLKSWRSSSPNAMRCWSWRHAYLPPGWAHEGKRSVAIA